ncbi:MAG: hypothetical protein HY747_03975 [Elusimicrobia bacterium]|nr:hypothetical protein [Elusimicrobiota bacterium]
MTLLATYCRLSTRFGPQGWWPITQGDGGQGSGARNHKDSKPRYHPGRFPKLTPKQAFEIAVGAILTQNTAWPNVEKALIELHKKNLMSPRRILQASSLRLQAYIRTSGYFKQKAKKLKILARFIERGAGGNILNLKNEPLPQLRDKLLSLWGVGPETADSILLYALDKPVFVVDAYTRRIGERLGWPFKNAGYDDIRLFFEERLPKDIRLYQEFHALFVELAKKNCLKNKPFCQACPLSLSIFPSGHACGDG